MAEFTGKDLHITFKGTVISGRYTEWADKREMGLVEASAGADAARTYLKTLLNGDGAFTSRYQGGTSATDEYNLLTAGANGTLIISPKGTAVNNPKLTISDVIVKTSDRSLKFDDVVMLKAAFQFNAAPSDGTW